MFGLQVESWTAWSPVHFDWITNYHHVIYFTLREKKQKKKNKKIEKNYKDE